MTIAFFAGWYARGMYWEKELDARAEQIATRHGGVYIPEVETFMTKAPKALDMSDNEPERFRQLIRDAIRRLPEQ